MKQRIGIDISLGICQAEGYMTCIVTSEEDFKVLTPTKVIEFGMTFPCSDDNVGAFPPYRQSWMSAKDIFKTYTTKKKGIDSFADCDYTEIATDIYTLLRMAADVENYCGAIFENTQIPRTNVY